MVPLLMDDAGVFDRVHPAVNIVVIVAMCVGIGWCIWHLWRTRK